MAAIKELQINTTITDDSGNTYSAAVVGISKGIATDGKVGLVWLAFKNAQACNDGLAGIPFKFIGTYEEFAVDNSNLSWQLAAEAMKSWLESKPEIGANNVTIIK